MMRCGARFEGLAVAFTSRSLDIHNVHQASTLREGLNVSNLDATMTCSLMDNIRQAF